MNLAKAVILLRTPGFVDHNLMHGISPQSKTGSLRKQKLSVKPNGIFPMLYKTIVGRALSHNSTLKIADLLGYVSDVQHEYVMLKYGPKRSFPCKYTIGINQTTQKAFSIIAVADGKNPAFGQLRKIIEKSFDHVDFPVHQARNIFDMFAEQRAVTEFFESKIEHASPVDHAKIVPATVSALASIISYSPFDDEILFLVNRPIRTPSPAPMHEVIAIYSCMFFFGSLVRYRPNILEAMLSTKDAWIIERFVKCAPLTFIRHLRNLFDAQYLAYTTR